MCQLLMYRSLLRPLHYLYMILDTHAYKFHHNCPLYHTWSCTYHCKTLCIHHNYPHTLYYMCACNLSCKSPYMYWYMYSYNLSIYGQRSLPLYPAQVNPAIPTKVLPCISYA